MGKYSIFYACFPPNRSRKRYFGKTDDITKYFPPSEKNMFVSCLFFVTFFSHTYSFVVKYKKHTVFFIRTCIKDTMSWFLLENAYFGGNRNALRVLSALNQCNLKNILHEVRFSSKTTIMFTIFLLSSMIYFHEKN